MHPATLYRIAHDELIALDYLETLHGFEDAVGDFFTLTENRNERLAGPNTWVLQRLGLPKGYHKTPAAAWYAKLADVRKQIEARELSLAREKRRASRLAQAAFDAIPLTGNGNEVNRDR